MRICVIDLGSNSVRFDIYQLFHEKAYKKIYSEKLMIQLGKDAFSLGYFSKKTLTNTLSVFQYFSRLLTTMHVDQTHAFATAAVRHVKNKDAFIQNIKNNAGISLHLISGDQEAQFIYQGLISNHNTRQAKKFLCVDIGGGSTEISMQSNNKTFHQSIPLGSSLIKEVFLHHNPPSPAAIQHLRLHIQKTLAQHFASWPKENLEFTFGSSGTVKGIVKVLKKNQYKKQSCSLIQLQKLIQKTHLLDYHGLKNIPFLEEKRIAMFTGGNILLEEVLLYFKCTKFEYSDAALKEGLLQSLLSKYSPQIKLNPIALKPSQHCFIKAFSIHKTSFAHFKKQNLILKNIFSKDALGFEDTQLMLFLHLCSMQHNEALDYASIASVLEQYPYFYSEKHCKSIKKLFKLLFGYESIKLQHPSQKNIVAAASFFIWLQKQNFHTAPKYTIKQSILFIDVHGEQFSFLQAKQFEQVKKTFQEQFDLKIKLLYECNLDD